MRPKVTLRKLRDYLNNVPDDRLDNELYVYSGGYSDDLKPVVNIVNPKSAFQVESEFDLLIMGEEKADFDKLLKPAIIPTVKDKE